MGSKCLLWQHVRAAWRLSSAGSLPVTLIRSDIKRAHTHMWRCTKETHTHTEIQTHILRTVAASLLIPIILSYWVLNGSLHDSESLRKIARRRMGGGEEGRGPQQTSLLWFSHDSSAQQMSMSNRASVCVCVRASPWSWPPAPPLHRFIAHTPACHRPGCQGNLLCWWVHLCVNHRLAIMTKGCMVCVCVCPCKVVFMA